MPKKTLIAAAAGSAFMASMAAAPIVSAAENPFTLSGLSSGYQVADNHAGKQEAEMKPTDKKMPEGKCGEGKCGATKKEGKDVEMKPTDKKMPEGKCGEGKCGIKKK